MSPSNDTEVRRAIHKLAHAVDDPTEYDELRRIGSGRRRSTRLPVVFVAGIAVVLGVFGGLLVRWISEPEATTLSEPTPLSGRVAVTDLLVEVDQVTSLGAEEFDFGVVESWSLRVVDVLQSAEVASAQEQEPDVPYILPKIGPGDEVIVGATRSSMAARQDHGFKSVSNKAIVSATYFPPHRINGHKSGWVLNYVATVDGDGAWTFHNSTSGEVWRSQLSVLSDRLAAMSETELMVSWSKEADAERRGEKSGPINQALATLGQRDPSQEWFALPADERPLDVELTPPEIVATLRSIDILVDIESAPQLDDRFLVIKTDSGIVHATVLTAGNHALNVLASPGDEWRIVVTDNPVNGRDELIATVAIDDWERAAASDDVVLVRYDAEKEGAAAVIDREGARALIDQWTTSDAIPVNE